MDSSKKFVFTAYRRSIVGEEFDKHFEQVGSRPSPKSSMTTEKIKVFKPLVIWSLHLKWNLHISVFVENQNDRIEISLRSQQSHVNRPKWYSPKVGWGERYCACRCTCTISLKYEILRLQPQQYRTSPMSLLRGGRKKWGPYTNSVSLRAKWNPINTTAFHSNIRIQIRFKI